MHERGRIRFILEVFKCSGFKKDTEIENNITSKIASTILSKKGLDSNPRDVAKIVSSKNRLTNKQEVSLTGSKLKVKEKVSSKGKDMNGVEKEILQFNDKDMIVK